MLASCVNLFFFVMLYLWPWFDELKSKEMKRFKPAYEMLNLRHGKWTMLYPLVFMIRRLLFVFAVCILIDFTEAQIVLFLAPTIFNLSILAAIHPLEDLPTNQMEIFNSCMVMLMIYCLLCFTPLAVNPMARYIMGFVMIGLVAFNIIANIVVVSVNPVRKTYIRCKSLYARRKEKFQKLRQKAKTCCWKIFYCKGSSNTAQETEKEDPQFKKSRFENKLATISEEYRDDHGDSSNSSDSELHSERQLVKLRAKLQDMETARGVNAEEFNQTAVQILDLQAKQNERNRSEKMHSEVYNMEAFGQAKKPQSRRLQLPNIEDLLLDLKESSSRIKSHAIDVKQSKKQELKSQYLDDQVVELEEIVDQEQMDRVHLKEFNSGKIPEKHSDSNMNSDGAQTIKSEPQITRDFHLNQFANTESNTDFANIKPTVEAKISSKNSGNPIRLVVPEPVDSQNLASQSHESDEVEQSRDISREEQYAVTSSKKIPVPVIDQIVINQIQPPIKKQMNFNRDLQPDEKSSQQSELRVSLSALGNFDQTTVTAEGQTALFPDFLAETVSVQIPRSTASVEQEGSDIAKTEFQNETSGKVFMPEQSTSCKVGPDTQTQTKQPFTLYDQKQRLRNQLDLQFQQAYRNAEFSLDEEQKQPQPSSRRDKQPKVDATGRPKIKLLQKVANPIEISSSSSDSLSQQHESREEQQSLEIVQVASLLTKLNSLREGSRN